jgi:hypothetical protein
VANVGLLLLIEIGSAFLNDEHAERPKSRQRQNRKHEDAGEDTIESLKHEGHPDNAGARVKKNR